MTKMQSVFIGAGDSTRTNPGNDNKDNDTFSLTFEDRTTIPGVSFVESCLQNRCEPTGALIFYCDSDDDSCNSLKENYHPLVYELQKINDKDVSAQMKNLKDNRLHRDMFIYPNNPQPLFTCAGNAKGVNQVDLGDILLGKIYLYENCVVSYEVSNELATKYTTDLVNLQATLKQEAQKAIKREDSNVSNIIETSQWQCDINEQGAYACAFLYGSEKLEHLYLVCCEYNDAEKSNVSCGSVVKKDNPDAPAMSYYNSDYQLFDVLCKPSKK